VLADIPGIIEGASEGAGLGIRFLKHLERVRMLCHLIEIPLELSNGSTEVATDLLVEKHKILRKELAAFSDELSSLPEVVVINKTDVLSDGTRPSDHPAVKALAKHLKKSGTALFFTSAATGEGIEALKFALSERVRQARAPKPVVTTYDPLAGQKLH
jgi:GTP-binding protein